MASSACTKFDERAEVIVTIAADTAVIAKVEDVFVEVEVKAPDGGWVQKQVPRRFEPDGQAAWPITFVVDDVTAASGTYQLTATARDRRQAVVAEARAIREFRTGRRLELKIVFEAACMFLEPCGRGQTCHEARCVDARDTISTPTDVADGAAGEPSTTLDAGPTGAGADRPCTTAGARNCVSHGSRTPLECDGNTWIAQAPCDESARCDTAPGETQGQCRPIAPECQGQEPNSEFCAEEQMRICPDLVSFKIRPCQQNAHCVSRPSGASCACLSGFVDVDDGAACREGTECGGDNGGCDELTRCSMNQGTRTCSACPAGFVGKGESGCYPLLIGLMPERGLLTPSFNFDSELRDFRLRVPLLAQRVSISFAAPAAARIAVNGLTLPPGASWTSPVLPLGDSSPVQVTVTGQESGLSSAYRLIIERAGMQEAYVKAGSPGDGDGFGVSLGLSKDTLVVGALYEDSASSGVNADPSNDDAQDSGAAYVFVRQGERWTQQAYLKPSDTARKDFFGTSVAVSDDTIAVGAIHDDLLNLAPSNTRSGAVYVFVRKQGNWSFQAQLTPRSGNAGDVFGYHVALEGDTLVVGSARDGDSGAAYVFVRNGESWTEQQKLKASSPMSGSLFGCNVALSGDTIVVGAQYDATGARDAGAAYIFEKRGETWIESQKVVPDPPQEAANFGYVVALYGDTMIAGAPRLASVLSFAATPSGEAYVYERTAGRWMQTQVLKTNMARTSDYFGMSVAVTASAILVGASGDTSGGRGIASEPASGNRPYSGAAYLYARDGTAWRPTAFIKAEYPGQNDIFGFSSTMTDDALAISANFESSNAAGIDGDQQNNSLTNSGAVYLFR